MTLLHIHCIGLLSLICLANTICILGHVSLVLLSSHSLPPHVPPVASKPAAVAADGSTLSLVRLSSSTPPHPHPHPLCSITYVAAHQVDEHRARLSLPPLASVLAEGPSPSPISPNPSPEPVLAAANRSPLPVRATTPSSSHLKHSASVRSPAAAAAAAPGPPLIRASASFRGPALDSR